MNDSHRLFDIWRVKWRQQDFRIECVVSVALVVVEMLLFTRFLGWVEERPGAVLPDPILALFTPTDVTWLTFGMIYVGLFLALTYLSMHPVNLIIALQSYALLIFLRTVAMYVVPLDPPQLLIPLEDPLVQFFGKGGVLTKDLFFSGHTSTMFLLSLVMPHKAMRRYFLVLTCAVGFCVIWQHVHYTIDVLVAPLFAYASYRSIMLLQGKFVQ